MVSFVLYMGQKSLTSSYYHQYLLTYWPKSVIDEIYNPTNNDLVTMKEIMTPINTFISSYQDIGFNYIMLTTAKYYYFFSFCSHNPILLVGISYKD